MALHHYLPATYLASFSNECTSPRRERTIAVGDKRSKRVFRASVAKIGAIQNFYSLADEPEKPQLLETAWRDYETNLANAVEQLITRKLDARTWAGVLVPFVAGMLVRGPDFNERFEVRIRSLGVSAGPDNTTRARYLELQRLLGPIVAAKWIVMKTRGGGSLITNDVGFAPFANLQRETGLVVPLGHAYVLGIIPRRRGAIVEARNGKWWPLIEHVELYPENHRDLNITLALGARRFIFGADESTVAHCLTQVDDSPCGVPEPGQLGFIFGPLAMVHEFTWHRLTGVLTKPPDHEDAWKFDLDWKAIASVWKPPAVVFPLNLPEFPPALRREGNVIYVDFYDVEGLTT